MVSKEQVIRALRTYIDNDVLPHAEGNYKIIMNLVKVALTHRADSIFEALKKNSFISMLGVIDEQDCVDMETLVQMLTEGLGTNEFTFKFKVLSSEYVMHISVADIQAIKRYV